MSPEFPAVYASPGRRLLGAVLDAVVMAVAALVLLSFFGVSIEQMADGEIPPGWVLAYLLLFGAYQIGFIGLRGQTPGKIAVRIQVVDSGTGAIPTFQAAAVRWVIVAAASSVPQIGVVAPLVVYGWLLVDPRRQGIHDKVARTVVIDLLLPTEPPVWRDLSEPGREGDLL